jgi:hypothetical protein
VGGNGFGGQMEGEIFTTNDGGKTWVRQLTDYKEGFWDVYQISPNEITVVGSGGTILRTNTNQITEVNDDNPKDEFRFSKFELSQNYPNPFNPSTTIKYSIQKYSNVTLKVFDILGREVSTLVNKEQTQGNYEIEFDGSDLTSGIYFYRLQVYPAVSGAGDYVETKKMILLK